MSMVETGEINNMSDDDIPDDFFDELANAEFIEDLVEGAQDGDLFDSGSNQNDSRENSPRMARCLAEIDVLTKDIERRKKKLEMELSHKGLSEQDLRQKLDRDIDDDERRLHRSRRNRERGRQSNSQSRSRSRSQRSKSNSGLRSPPYRGVHRERDRDRDRVRERERDERGHRRHHIISPLNNRRRHGRRSQSPSPNGKRRSSSTHKTLTFLEELAKTFAAQGKPFHEADILAQAKSASHEQSAPMPLAMNAPIEPNMMPMQMNMQPFPPTMPPHINPIVYPNVGYPTGMYYGMEQLPPNPMPNISGGPSMMQPSHMNQGPPIPMSATSAAMNNVELTCARGVTKSNQKALLEKCANAVKCINAEESKVQKLRFLFTRTQFGARNQQNIDPLLDAPRKSPLAKSPFNADFKLNSTDSTNSTLDDALAARRQLPSRLRGIVKALSINSNNLTSKMRSREIVSQLSLDFMATAAVQADSTQCFGVPSIAMEPDVAQMAAPAAPAIQTCSTITQTDAYECGACKTREKRVFLNKSTQMFVSHKVGSTQTDEDDYRGPLVSMLGRLSDAQLVAIKDFIATMTTPRPQNITDLCSLRERLMDIYNLSQRDSDAVRVAQRNNLDDPVVINQKRFRSCDSFGDSGSSRDREFDNSPHGRRSNGSDSFNQNERYADADDRHLRLRNDERQRAQEQELERMRYEEEMARRRQAEEEEAHEREKQRMRLLEEQEFQLRIQREEEELLERRRQQQLMGTQQQQQQVQQQQEQIFGFGNRTGRDDGPSYQSSFRNANRNARGAFRNDRGSLRGNARGGRGRKF